MFVRRPTDAVCRAGVHHRPIGARCEACKLALRLTQGRPRAPAIVAPCQARGADAEEDRLAAVDEGRQCTPAAGLAQLPRSALLVVSNRPNPTENAQAWDGSAESATNA